MMPYNKTEVTLLIQTNTTMALQLLKMLQVKIMIIQVI